MLNSQADLRVKLELILFTWNSLDIPGEPLDPLYH